MHGDGGRADIAGEAVDPVVEARPDGTMMRLANPYRDSDGDAPVALAQRLLQALDRAHVAIEVLRRSHCAFKRLVRAAPDRRAARACRARPPRRNAGGRPD